MKHVCKFCEAGWNEDRPCKKHQLSVGHQECPLCLFCQGRTDVNPITVATAKTDRADTEKRLKRLRAFEAQIEARARKAERTVDDGYFPDLIGQADIVARLQAFNEFFASKGGTPGHVLLVGQEGMGKSIIAAALANERNVGFQTVDAEGLRVQGDLTALLTNLRANQIIQLSNLHLLPRTLAVRLRGGLRNGKLEIIIGQGPAARTHVMDLKPFTIIATCPKKSDCPAELLGEFSLVLTLQPYSRPELRLIAESIAQTAGVSLDSGAAELIARGCDGRPGHLKQMFERVTRAISKTTITEEDVAQAFAAFGISARPDTSSNGVANIGSLSGQDFEKLITTLLTRMGFQAEMTRTTGDGGIDIIAVLDKPIVGGRYLFQCKRFAPDNLVGAATVRDFYGAVMADRAVKGILITTSDFTAQAQEFGEKAGVELINLARLEGLLREHGLTEFQN